LKAQRQTENLLHAYRTVTARTYLYTAAFHNQDAAEK